MLLCPDPNWALRFCERVDRAQIVPKDPPQHACLPLTPCALSQNCSSRAGVGQTGGSTRFGHSKQTCKTMQGRGGKRNRHPELTPWNPFPVRLLAECSQFSALILVLVLLCSQTAAIPMCSMAQGGT